MLLHNSTMPDDFAVNFQKMGEVTKKIVHCYNRGCGKTFALDDNREDSCVYHSGQPYFHDAYKEWTCCQKRTTDFTEFLDIKGCTRGMHNGNRPTSLDKPKEQADDSVLKTVENIFSNCTNLTRSKAQRNDVPDDLPLVVLTPEISPRLLQQNSSQTPKAVIQINDGVVPVGTPCKNTSCSVSYKEGIRNECFHHPGSAIFHEGLKYWSCCRKITSDFSKFLEQTGCTVGTHVWFKEKQTVQCRVDWHQTGGVVVVSVFAKNYDPHKSSVSLSPTRLQIYIHFYEGEQVFEKEYQLYSVVKVESSHVAMLPTKVEIKLAKSQGDYWSNLCKEGSV